MAVFVAALFVACLIVFLMTGGDAMTGLSAKQKNDIQVTPAPVDHVLKIPQPVVGLLRSIENEADDIEMIAKDVSNRLNQIETVFCIFQTVSYLLMRARDDADFVLTIRQMTWPLLHSF